MYLQSIEYLNTLWPFKIQSTFLTSFNRNGRDIGDSMGCKVYIQSKRMTMGIQSRNRASCAQLSKSKVPHLTQRHWNTVV